MNEMANHLKIALFQVSTGSDFRRNIDQANNCFEGISDEQCGLVIFPENIWCRSNFEDIRAAGNPESFYSEQFGAVSRRYSRAALWGGVPVIYDHPHGEKRLYNTAMLFDTNGNLLVTYRKIHLFEFRIDRGGIDESTLYHAAAQPLMVDFNGWKIGLSICYDLRFPELFREYVGADLMICTADFTYFTGKSHWEILLRSRAIENQCYMIGVNQCGKNVGMNVRSYGHSMLVDPWGKIIASAEDDETVVIGDVKKHVISRIRERLPALESVRLIERC